MEENKVETEIPLGRREKGVKLDKVGREGQGRDMELWMLG